MRRQVRTPIIVICILSALCLSAGGVAESTTDFQIEPDSPTPIPQETVTYDGYTEQFTSVTTTMPGETIEVTAVGPAETGYIVHLAEDTDTTRRSTGAVGEEPITMDTDSLSPGTYALAIEHNGTVKATHPVIIQAYEIEQPETITADKDEPLTVKITLSKSRDNVEDPAEVEMTLWNDSTEQSVMAEQINTTAYEATFSAETVTEDAKITTEIYGSNERFDTRERLAVSEPSAVNVTAASTPTPTETTTHTPTSSPTVTDTATSTPTEAPSDQASNPATTATTTAATTTTSTPPTEQTDNPRTETPTPRESIDTTASSTPTHNETPTSEMTTTTQDNSQDTNTASSRTRTATPPSENPETTGGTGPGLTVVQAEIAVLLSFYFLRRRQ